MAGMRHRVAILHPAEAAPRQSTEIERTRLARVAETLRGAGLEVAGAPYSDEAVEEMPAQLLQADGVLVWVNPIDGGRDRSPLNGFLARVAAAGVFGSAQPEGIRQMGTTGVMCRATIGSAPVRERGCQNVLVSVV